MLQGQHLVTACHRMTHACRLQATAVNNSTRWALLHMPLLSRALPLLLSLLLSPPLCNLAAPGPPVQHSMSSSVLSPAHRTSCGSASLMCFTMVPVQDSQKCWKQSLKLGQVLLS